MVISNGKIEISKPSHSVSINLIYLICFNHMKPENSHFTQIKLSINPQLRSMNWVRLSSKISRHQIPFLSQHTSLRHWPNSLESDTLIHPNPYLNPKPKSKYKAKFKTVELIESIMITQEIEYGIPWGTWA